LTIGVLINVHEVLQAARKIVRSTVVCKMLQFSLSQTAL